MNTRKLILITGFSLFWSGCSYVDKQPPLEHWTAFNNQAFNPAEQIAEGHARIVLLRDKNALAGPAANIFIGGHYLTSLLPGGYKSLQVCANPTKINAAYTQSNLNYYNVRQQDQMQNLAENKTYYFSLAEGQNNQIQIQALTDQQAQNLMPNVKEEINTLSRVRSVQDCQKPVVISVPTKAVIKKYTLQANTLFNFAKSGPSDLKLQGRDEIAKIAAEISHDQKAISHVAVIGYTDPVGTELSNQRLSQLRAETVRGLLVSNGVGKQNILVEGRGEQDLIVSDCENLYMKDKVAREQCDLPNRRVEIVTYGMKAE